MIVVRTATCCDAHVLIKEGRYVCSLPGTPAILTNNISTIMEKCRCCASHSGRHSPPTLIVKIACIVTCTRRLVASQTILLIPEVVEVIGPIVLPGKIPIIVVGVRVCRGAISILRQLICRVVEVVSRHRILPIIIIERRTIANAIIQELVVIECGRFRVLPGFFGQLPRAVVLSYRYCT